jgi:hypothetical protein
MRYERALLQNINMSIYYLEFMNNYHGNEKNLRIMQTLSQY